MAEGACGEKGTRSEEMERGKGEGVSDEVESEEAESEDGDEEEETKETEETEDSSFEFTCFGWTGSLPQEARRRAKTMAGMNRFMWLAL